MGNLIDRIVEYRDPAEGLRRAAARQALSVLNSGYSEGGASTRKSSMRKWSWRGGSAREDIELPLSILRQRSRDLFMNSPIGRAIVGRLGVNAVASGLRLRSTPDADALGLSQEEARAWARMTERDFALWAESRECDFVGLNTFYELQQVALPSWAMNGDAFALLTDDDPVSQPYSLRVQLVEADRVCNPGSGSWGAGGYGYGSGAGTYDGWGLGVGAFGPSWDRMRSGVEIDGKGRVVAYHIRSTHPLGVRSYSPASWTRVPARGASGRLNILHLINQERVDQYRGVPLLAPVIEAVKQLTRYSQAEVAASVATAFAIFSIKSVTPQNPFAEEAPAEAGAGSSQSESTPAANLDWGPATVIPLSPDEDFTSVIPNRPNGQFGAFTESMAKEIGAAVNIPAEILLAKFDASYSAARGALLEAWKFFRMWRDWMANDFCQPIYVEWLTEAVLLGRVKAPGFLDDPVKAWAWARSQWHGPSQGQIQPVQEVTAAKLRVENGFSSFARESMEISGSDFDVVVQEQTAEREMLRGAGIVIPSSGVIDATPVK